jgi:hypothetical protein
MNDARTQQVNVRVDGVTYDWIKARAKDEGRSVGNLIAWLLKQELIKDSSEAKRG